MKDYAKAISTIKALNEAFGSKEFTRKDYNEMMKNHVTKYYESPFFDKTNKPIEYDIYSAGHALTLDSKYKIVKVVRTEDVWYKVDDDTKKRSIRFYYQIDKKAIKKFLVKTERDAKDTELLVRGKIQDKEAVMRKDERIINSREEEIKKLDAKIARAKARQEINKQKHSEIEKRYNAICSAIMALDDAVNAL